MTDHVRGTPENADEVIEFWFGRARAEDAAIAQLMPFWFSSNPDNDKTISRRFGAMVAAARKGALESWQSNAAGRLGLVILLDQFPRNLFRGTSDAFASDSEALRICLASLDDGDARRLAAVEQVFLMMPMQHAESLSVQQRSVQAYTQLLNSLDPGRRPHFEGFLKYARLHHDIVARFGRFPHRNAILGRENTPAETDYLAGNAPRFGQGGAVNEGETP